VDAFMQNIQWQRWQLASRLPLRNNRRRIAHAECHTFRELAAALQGLNAPQLIDVRRKAAFDASEQMITGAIWRNPDELGHWIATLDANRPVTVYCVHGHQVSQDCAALLEAVGFDATYLVGGFEDWIAGNHPTIRKPLRIEP
jgi:rhodanese-related sulfurtransferase